MAPSINWSGLPNYANTVPNFTNRHAKMKIALCAADYIKPQMDDNLNRSKVKRKVV